MRTSYLSLAALGVLSACGTADIAAPAAVTRDAAARPGGHRVVILRASMPDAPGDAGAPVANNLVAAVAAVAAGGTIRVHPGDYSAESVLIDKPVTIEGVGSAKPVFRTVSDLQGIRLQHGGGTVTLRGLEFRNDFAGTLGFSYSIRATGGFANVTVEDSDFIMKTGGHASALFASNGGIVGGSRLTVTRSRFIGGRAGIAAVGNAVLPGPSAIAISDSRFEGQREAVPGIGSFAIQVRSADVSIERNVFIDCGRLCANVSGTFAVTDNEFADCGATYCLHAFSGAGTIARNRMSNSVPGDEEWFLHHVLLLNSSVSATVEDNEVDGCGYGQCIVAIARASGVIRNNRITARHGDRTRIGIVLSDGEAGNSAATDRGASFTVTGNVLTGLGGPADPAPDDPASYAFSVSGLQAEGHSTMRADANAVHGADIGMLVRTGSVMEGERNRVNRVRAGIVAVDVGTRATLRWNDITRYRRALDQSGHTGSDLTCNFWDTPAGPQNYSSSQGASLFSPWATEPVAASSGGTCSGGA